MGSGWSSITAWTPAQHLCWPPSTASQMSTLPRMDAPPVRRYEESAQSNCSPLQGTASVFTACSVSFTHLSHLSAWVERVLCAWVYSQRTPALPSHWPAQLVVQSLLELMLSKQADHSTTSSRMIFFFSESFWQYQNREWLLAQLQLHAQGWSRERSGGETKHSIPSEQSQQSPSRKGLRRVVQQHNICQAKCKDVSAQILGSHLCTAFP